MKIRKSEKYLIGRVDSGANCCRSEDFVLDKTVQKVATMFGREQVEAAIQKIKRMPPINGIKGLISKQDAAEALKSLLKDEFQLPKQ